MRIVWVTRSFLDYRIPVYTALSRFSGHNFFLVFADEMHINPQRVVQKAKDALGERAIALKGEKRIGQRYDPTEQSKAIFRYFYQPGLAKIITSLKPDVIITDAFNHWTIPVFRIRFSIGIKHVMCYERTKYTERNTPWLKIFLRKRTFNWIDHIVCNGSLCAEYVEWLGFPKKSISNGNMAADYEGLQSSVKNIEVKSRNRLKDLINAKGIIFLYVGQFIPRKGIMELLKSWDEFSEELKKEATLILVGGGNQEGAVKEYISKQKLQNVIVSGSVDYSEIAKYYAIADVFIIATLEDNWSLVVPEAMSVGLPIICSKYNGCWPELVRPENGWVFDPLNRENFVDTLRESWAKRSNWKEMGQKSLEIVQNYTPEKVAGNIYNACLSVLGK